MSDYHRQIKTWAYVPLSLTQWRLPLISNFCHMRKQTTTDTRMAYEEADYHRYKNGLWRSQIWDKSNIQKHILEDLILWRGKKSAAVTQKCQGPVICGGVWPSSPPDIARDHDYDLFFYDYRFKLQYKLNTGITWLTDKNSVDVFIMKLSVWSQEFFFWSSRYFHFIFGLL